MGMNFFKLKRCRKILWLKLLVIIPASLFALVPQVVDYQGYLTDGAGNPVEDDQYQMIFTIYDTPTGIPGIWYSGSQPVDVENGLFTYQLGSVNPLQDDIFADTSRWLGIKVGLDDEISPRTKLTSQPYAYQALRSDSSDFANDIADGSVTNSKIAAASVTDDKLDDNAVTNAKLANLAVTSGKIADQAISTTKLADESITSMKITDGTIQFSDIGQNGAATGQVMEWDGSAWVADGVSSAEIPDEPGVAQKLMAVVTALSGGVEVVLSREITTPANGYVLAIASFSVQALHVNGTSTGVSFGLSTSTAFSEYVHYWGIMSSEPTGTRNDIFTVSRMFSVSAGTTTFYLLGLKASGGANPDVFSKSLSLAFFPTAYGTFDN